MVEKITSIEYLQKTYKLETKRNPKSNDLVFIPSLMAVYEVKQTDRQNIRVEGTDGKHLVFTPAQYRLIIKK
jgi:hypothetical protein